MEGLILGFLGKIAAVASVGLGIFLLVFQRVLQKQFLPQARGGRRYARLRMLAGACLIWLLTQPGIARSQSGCLPSPDSSYVKFDASRFFVRKSPDFDNDDNIDFEIRPCEFIGANNDLRVCLATFAVENIKIEGSLMKMQIHVDDDLEWVGVPLARIFEVRLSQSLGGWSGNWWDDNLAGVPACALGPRRAEARAIFSNAFELLRQGQYKSAEDEFSNGLVLDPMNGNAAIYFAEAKLRAGDSDGMMLAYYTRGYELLGVPPAIATQAIEEQTKRVTK